MCRMQSNTYLKLCFQPPLIFLSFTHQLQQFRSATDAYCVSARICLPVHAQLLRSLTSHCPLDSIHIAGDSARWLPCTSCVGRLISMRPPSPARHDGAVVSNAEPAGHRGPRPEGASTGLSRCLLAKVNAKGAIVLTAEMANARVAGEFSEVSQLAKYAFEPYWPASKLKVCVTGAGGFIASHLARRLKSEGHYIVACDWKRNEHMPVGLHVARSHF